MTHLFLVVDGKVVSRRGACCCEGFGPDADEISRDELVETEGECFGDYASAGLAKDPLEVISEQRDAWFNELLVYAEEQMLAKVVRKYKAAIRWEAFLDSLDLMDCPQPSFTGRAKVNRARGVTYLRARGEKHPEFFMGLRLI